MSKTMKKENFKNTKTHIIEIIDNNSFFTAPPLDKIQVKFIPHASVLDVKEKYKSLQLERINEIVNKNKIEFASFVQEKFDYLASECGFENKANEDFGINKLLRLDNLKLWELASDFEESLEIVLSRFSDIQRKIISERVEGNTLQSIGDEFGITRERVRQVCKKYVSHIHPILVSFCSIFFGCSIFCSVDITTTGLGSKWSLFVEKLLIESEVCDYFPEFDLYTLSNSKEAISIRRLILYLESKEEVDFDTLNELEEMYETQVSEEKITEFLISSGYVQFNDKYVRYRSYAKYLLLIIGAEFSGGIELRQLRETDDFKKLIQLSRYYFPKLRHSLDSRNIHTRLTEHLVSFDRSLYLLPSKIEYNSYDLSTVVDYMYGQDKSIFYFTFLYEKFKNLLQEQGIMNWYFLRELLKNYELNSVRFNRDYLELTTQNRGGHLSDQILNYIQDCGMPVEKRTIHEKFSNYTDVMIYNVLTFDNRIVKWGYGRYICVSLLEKIDQKQEICNFISNRLNLATYLSYELIFIELANNFNLKQNFIFTPENVKDFMFLHFPDKFDYFYEGMAMHNSGLSKALPKRLATLMGNFPYWKYSEFARFTNVNGFSQKGLYDFARELSKNSLQLDGDKYLLKSYFSCDEELIDIVENKIDTVVANEKLISPHYLLSGGYLPYNHEYHWNWFHFASLLNNYGKKYKVIYPVPSDRRNNDGLLVSRDYQGQLSDFVAECLESLGVFNISEKELTLYLNNRKVVKGALPYEFYKNELFQLNDGIFSISHYVDICFDND